jgi:hypothetical protein
LEKFDCWVVCMINSFLELPVLGFLFLFVTLLIVVAIKIIIKNKKMGRILLWVGGLYGIVVGLYSAFGPTSEYQGTTCYSNGTCFSSSGYTTMVQVEGFPFAIAVAVIALLLFSGSIVLLKKMKLGLMAGLLLVQAIMEILSIFSLGINFLPATILLTVATILCSKEGTVRNTNE